MIEDTLREIKRDCTAAMNGIVSQSMRDYGLDYKLNFGLRAMQIKAIANKYGKSAELANLLWQEKTRELLILATLTYPIEEFSENKAEDWGRTIKNQEIREQICMNLFQELPFAQHIALQWIQEDDIELRTTGYWLLQRLLLSKKIEGTLAMSMLTSSYLQNITSDNLFLRNASTLVGKHFVRQSKECATEMIRTLKVYKDSENKLQAEAYNAIVFEAQFIWDDFF